MYVEEDLLYYGVLNMLGIVVKMSFMVYSYVSVLYLLYYLEYGLKGFLIVNIKIVVNIFGGLSVYNGYII